jgi:hypothetical protein
MFSLTISRAFSTVTKEFLTEKFAELDLGEFTVDELEVTRHERTGKQFWIHFKTCETEFAKQLRDRLEANAAKQKNGEVLAATDIPKLVYGVNRRNGNDMYWQLYKCATPDERKAAFEAREAEEAAKAEAPKVKIVL